jgi:hypothetical protein
MLAWTMAGELPKLPLADGLELVLLESDVEPARFARAVPRSHARLCSERQLSTRGGAVCTSRLERPAGAGRAVRRPVARRGLRDPRLGPGGSGVADLAQSPRSLVARRSLSETTRRAR